ncbi:MAG: Formylglycine-generating enzyme, required for sulfatase activity, contains SUMF1/FGE domain [Candidatus Methanocomedens sp.]|nr:MAG: Formylglycine-generating enzyme, required for sulfatase activity, contains SUMF1/FGE domain [ANME-2 cluster archaeon]
MSDIEIIRGYEVLPDNNVRFGIRVINNSKFLIVDVDVILDYSESLFKLDGDTIQNLGIINPTVPHTAEFILKPLGCIHREEIAATVRYKDHTGKRHTLDMRPKEVHCVCPFLKGKPMNSGEFFELSESGHTSEAGLNFQGVDAARLTSFLVQTCKSRHYKVDEHAVEGGTILYLASESIGEKAYYLLTAYIKETDGLTKVMLRAVSDKPHGLNGFLNEIVSSIRHIVGTVQSAREIGVIRKEQVINIIDSVVQRTTFAGGEGAGEVNIEGSVVQRTEFKGDDEQKKREEEQERQRRDEEERKKKKEAEEKYREQLKALKEKERAKKEREEQGRLHRETEESERKAREEVKRKEQDRARQEQEPKARPQEAVRIQEEQNGRPLAKFVALFLVLGVLAAGYWIMNPGQDNSTNIEPVPAYTPEMIATAIETSQASPTQSPSAVAASSTEAQQTTTNSIGMEFVLIPAGEFKMGSPSGEEGRYDSEGPVHTVKIEKAYYLGKYEVTQEQWREVMGTNPSSFKGDDLPVESVYWNDAQEFVRKLNEMEDTDKYRLPSNAEWEYAARAGTTTRYSFGNDESDLGDYAWYSDNSVFKTHQVGQKQHNPWGLYDMHGNVWEWVQDRCHDDYDGAPTDGSAWESGSSALRVCRGGGWFSDAKVCRSAVCDCYALGWGRHLGFRLLQEV